MNSCDLFVDNLKQVVTVSGFSSKPACGNRQGQLEIITDGAVAIKDGKFAVVGSRNELVEKGWADGADKYLDGTEQIALPGFVDPHTHLVFAGSREEEFLARIQGEDYLERLKAGGGILSTVRATRAASFSELLEKAVNWSKRLLEMGTTSCEIKSGYGLDLETEIKQLKVINRLKQVTDLDITATYLGAHAWPDEYSDDHQGYLNLIINQVLPRVAETELARYCDVFCEEQVFSPEESRKILRQAQRLGLELKIHADEINNLKGAELAAELQAVSADHLVAASAEGIKAMAEKGIIAVLLPATTFALQKEKYAPARQMIESGVPVALASDFNPGSSPVGSMSLVLSLACMKLGMSIEEAVTAVTINAAHAIGEAERIGSIEVGKQADLVLWDLDNYQQLPYYLGFNMINTVIKKGEIRRRKSYEI